MKSPRVCEIWKLQQKNLYAVGLIYKMKITLSRTLIAVSLFATALPVFAQTTSSTPAPSSTPIPSHSPMPKPIDLACMQTAIGKRDGAIISALDAYYNAAKSALTTRQSALQAAWGMTDKKTRTSAQRKAWSDYRASIKTARKTFQNARTSAWKGFATDAKACRGTTEEFGSQTTDEQL